MGRRRKRRTAQIAVLLSGAILAGCAGPSTRVLPRGQAPSRKEQEEIPLLEPANPFYIQESLWILSKSPRPSGSKGEMAAVEYMERLFLDYGYEVGKQTYTYLVDGKNVEGCNLSARKKTDNPDGDILLIGAWHDTETDSPGAGKNASGAAMLLETARLLSVLPTDTELRFVSFSGHEDRLMGVRHYVSRLSGREKQRIIGAVMLDPSGYEAGGKMVIGTPDGERTMAGMMLREASGSVYGQMWDYKKVPGEETSVFMGEEIPAVSIGMEHSGYEADTPLDKPEGVNAEALAQVTEAVCSVAAQIMDDHTPSMMAKSHSYNDRDYAFVQTKDTPSWFGETIEAVEAGTGRIGMYLTANTDNEGRTIEKYQFRMKWFGVDQLIMTNYYFTDGTLDLIVPEAAEAGIDFQEMKERLEAFYGLPAGENLGPNGTEYDWKDPAGGRFFALLPESNGYALEIREYRPEPVVLEERSLDGGILSQNRADVRCNAYMELLSEVLPDWSNLGKVTFFTDGVGGETGYLIPLEVGQKHGETRLWEIGLDPEDVFFQDGSWRDYTATVKQLLGLMAQELEASEPELKEAYLRLEQTEDRQEDFSETTPETAEGRETALPDFATAFTMFVTADRPKEIQGGWEQATAFFYQREDLFAYRSQVRQNLKFQTEERTETE